MGRFAALSSNSHLTIVLGAGASAPSGLPTWDQFARRLALLSGLVTTDEAASILLSKQDPTIVLEAAHAQAGEHWTSHLNQALYGDLPADPQPSPLHLAAAGHYLASRATTTLGTLNFDTLLESAISSEDTPLVVIDLEGDMDPAVPTVHHLHGAVFEDIAHTPVVGYRDFAELIANEGAWQREFLSQALARGPLLLAGTSYRDPDIRHWLHLIIRDEKPAHPALVTIVREGLELDRNTFAAIDSALAFEWESIGLTALQMHDLADVAHLIRELKFAGRPGYRTPSERARQIWEAHTKKFSSLQSDYSEALATDASSVTQALGATAHRGTLWLANGRGNVARWATEGSRYRGVRDLKLVPTGHDSPWIAGEAISSEEVKLKDVEREQRVTPTWRSVLAIPVFVGDGTLPEFAAAVLTFGLSQRASALLDRQDDWWSVTEELSTAWGTRLSGVAFSS